MADLKTPSIKQMMSCLNVQSDTATNSYYKENERGVN